MSALPANLKKVDVSAQNRPETQADALRERMRDVNPSMVTLARQSRGYTQTGLAKKIGCSQGTLSKVEQGTLSVSDELLDAIARELHYPQAFFLQEGDIFGPGIKYDRARKSLPKRVREQIDAQHNISVFQLRSLLRDVEFDINVPSLPIEQLGSPELAARALREYWNVPRGPIPNVTQLFEDNGFVIIHQDFGTEKWDGVYYRMPDAPPVIFLNSVMPGDRMRHTTAHEGGHKVMHTVPSGPKEMDDEADRFAAEFLMPEADILPDFRHVDLPTIARLKRKWGSSMAALLRRANDLGKINDRRYRYLITQMRRAGWAKREPESVAIPREKPSLRSEMINTHLRTLGYSPRKLSAKINLLPDEFVNDYLNGSPQLRRVK